MNKNKITLSLFAAGFILTGTAFAATDGELGSNSEGSLDISLSVGDENGGSGSILIQRLDDLDLGEFDASNPDALGDGTDFCVYRTGSPNGFDYSIDITGVNSTTTFQLLSDTTGDEIGYSVHYSSTTGADTDSDELSYGSGNLVSADTSVGLTDDGDGTFSCKGENVSLYVKASVADASVADAADDYEDTLTLVVAPR